MFGWFRPACPLATAEKVWVESRLAWLTERLGSERLRSARVIEPSDEFFPAPYDEQDDDAQRIFRQVCEWMAIDPARVVCELRDEITGSDVTNPLGLYIPGQPARILICRSELADPESLVGTIAHELAHETLLGGGHLQDNNEDLERLTDLTTVFCGLGIFCANSALRETTLREGRFSWWSLQKQGYLPLRMYGYGMSLFAWARDEKWPRWMSRLRLDARENMQRGLRYLWKTGDSTFQVEQPAVPPGEELETAAGRLSHSSTSFRFLGLSDLLVCDAVPADAIGKVAQLLDDRDPDVSSTAARVLGASGEHAKPHSSRLIDMLSSRSIANREQAAFALGELRADDPIVVRELSKLLEDEGLQVCMAATEALGKIGPAAESAGKQLMRRYEQSLIKCDACIDALAATLARVFPDAQDRVREHFSGIDAELCRFAEQCLADVRADEAVEGS